MNWTKVAVLLCALACAAACVSPTATASKQTVQEERQPESATARVSKAGWTAKKYLITSANPLATEAGYRMLSAGGSAVDAAIAAQMVLTLVEPQSSGLGGGAFLMYFDGDKVKAFDGRETAPAAANEKLFEQEDGQPMQFYDAVIGGRSTGVPGVLRMLEQAHKQYGKLPWPSLFAPAVELAENGFAVSPRLHALISRDAYLKLDAAAAEYFYDSQGNPSPVGHVLKNPSLAKTLRDIAIEGADIFYKGRIADDIVNKVRGHAFNPGILTRADMASYQAKQRDPLCSDYKHWTICGMPPPSSGGIAVAQMLGILQHTAVGDEKPINGMPTPQAIHLFAEAGKLAYADRGHYVADTDFVPLPEPGISALIAPDYLRARAKNISERSMGTALPGQPFPAPVALDADDSLEFAGTSHLSIVDGYGNALAMTTSIEDAFGSRQMVGGFLLNNQLTDFSFQANGASGLVANRVQGGKRPRSSMSPTLVFERGTKKPVLAVGSPGGSAIINYVAKVLVAMMDWGLNIQQAIDLPNFGSRNGPVELEQRAVDEAVIQALRLKGHDVRVGEQPSGLQGVMMLSIHGQDLWFAGADPRREGNAKGD
jgi:gamma-glutamyltranspeptidase/glutathione hydrolase